MTDVSAVSVSGDRAALSLVSAKVNDKKFKEIDNDAQVPAL